MGVIEFINKFKNQRKNKKYAKMLNGYIPIFTQFGKDIYASDVVQQAINCIVMELKKLQPQHIRETGSDPVPVKSDKQYILDEPNDRMTTSDFIEKIYWQLFLNYNSFIIPTYTTEFDEEGNIIKKYTGLYPIAPTFVEFRQDSNDKLYIYFQFRNGYECTLKYEDVIHLKYRFSVNEFMGGNENGQPDNKALLETLELNNTLLQGVGKALKSSFAINGIVKYNSVMDDGKTEQALKELQNHLENNRSGFLPIDLKCDFIPLQNKIQLVDATTLKFIDEKILRHFGVSLPILTGDYSKEQYEAFYQKTLEPLIISINQEFTKKLFTKGEKAHGNKIQFYPHELIFMSTDQKLSLFDLFVDTASCYCNELRTAFGKRPLPELVGKIAMSSNKTNAENNKIDESSKSTNQDNKKNDKIENSNKNNNKGGDEDEE